MKNKKCKIIFLVIITLIIVLVSIIIIKQKFHRYDVNTRIVEYDLKYEKDDYLNYLKQFIYPIKLLNFIDNDAVAFSIYNKTATGEAVIDQMKFNGYEYLFNSLFSYNQINIDDCPVTDRFKEKFSGNLLDYFELKESEDCESMCSLYRKDKEIIVEVYGNFKNTEPTYWTKHHFHYTLDDEGNVDDIVFDHTDK